MFSQIAAAQGSQVGQVLGFLARRVLGQYDVAVPRAGPGAVMFVVPNLQAFETDWSLDRTEFRTWVALHEVAHRFEFARPWARERFVGAPRRLPRDADDRRRGHGIAARHPGRRRPRGAARIARW